MKKYFCKQCNTDIEYEKLKISSEDKTINEKGEKGIGSSYKCPTCNNEVEITN